MAGTFELKKSGAEFIFHLKAGNNEIILASERYTQKQHAEGGITSVKTNAPHDNRYQRKTATNGQHYFVLTATNGEVIGTSETYKAASGMENGIAAVKNDAPTAPTKDLT
jgi:uncharacterized protein YegP (UPF0339 family)